MAAPRVALIMGAGPGLGAALVRSFRRADYLVAAASRSATNPEGVRAAFAGDAGVTWHDVDAGDEAAVAALVAGVESGVGPVEVCVFNVGGSDTFVRVRGAGK